MSEHQHEEAHTGPIKTPTQMMWVSLFSFVAPVFIIIGLVFFVVSDKKPAAGATNMDKSVAERIQKIGTVEIRDANRPLKSGEAVFQALFLPDRLVAVEDLDAREGVAQRLADVHGDRHLVLVQVGVDL